MDDKRFKVRLAFDISVRDITPEAVEEYVSAFDNADELLQNPAHEEAVARERRLLHVLLEDAALLRNFVAYRVVDSLEGAEGIGDSDLEAKLGAPRHDNRSGDDLFNVLEPAIARLSAEDAEYFRAAQEEGILIENTELIWESVKIEFTDATMESEAK